MSLSATPCIATIVPLDVTDLTSAIVLLFAFLIGHALADFPLQGQFLAQGKNRHLPPPILANGDDPPKRIWIYCLTAHALIHAGFVWVITGSVILGALELVIHWIIDALKTENSYGFETDQWLHIITKMVFVGLIWANIV